MNKRKIINDPVHGFIQIRSALVYDVIQHPYFQRLRHIRQLGLSDLVYPGAVHTRFHHALGAMHLMGTTLNTLRNNKGVDISDAEYEAAQLAILLHDIGHGAMSHALEYTLLRDVPHEEISRLFIQRLNEHFGGALSMALQIFEGSYSRRFFHQLVSSQLDMDRMDYLQRDSFFTGVHEGTIGSERIIKMLRVVNDELVVEEKGIYSIENFLTARRLMYWQVYLHKTNIAAEQMLIQAITRARHLRRKGREVWATPAFGIFLDKDVSRQDFVQAPEYLEAFALLDDHDITTCLKQWKSSPDHILALLSSQLLSRRLFKVELTGIRAPRSYIDEKRQAIQAALQLPDRHLKYFLVEGIASNSAYLAKGEHINILTKSGAVMDIAQASDLPNIKALRKIVRKFYVCWWKP